MARDLDTTTLHSIPPCFTTPHHLSALQLSSSLLTPPHHTTTLHSTPPHSSRFRELWTQWRRASSITTVATKAAAARGAYPLTLQRTYRFMSSPGLSFPGTTSPLAVGAAVGDVSPWTERRPEGPLHRGWSAFTASAGEEARAMRRATLLRGQFDIACLSSSHLPSGRSPSPASMFHPPPHPTTPSLASLQAVAATASSCAGGEQWLPSASLWLSAALLPRGQCC